MSEQTIEAPEIQTQPTETLSPASSQDQDRQALYAKYYETSSGNPPVETAPVTESTAQVVPSQETVPPTAQLPPEVLSLLESMRSEITDLKTKLSPPPPVATSTATEAQWVTLLREGKIDEAEAALAQAVSQRTMDSLIQQSTDQTRQVLRAEAEAERFTNELRAANPELVPMERWIATEAQIRMADARSKGLVKSPDDAVRLYKTAVTEALTDARKLYHQIRGDGKQEAQIRNREVLATRPVPPQQVDTSRPQVTGQEPQEPPVDTAQDYINRRKEANARRQGLAV